MKHKISFILLILVLGSINIIGANKEDYVIKRPENLKKSVMSVQIKDLIPHMETLKIVSLGDIMMHDIEISSGFNKETQTYNYDYMFDKVKRYVENGDITIGNLELTMSGEKDGGYTGYPYFNTPDSFAGALKNIGIDVLTTANNHSLDRHFKGLVHTIKVLDELKIAHTGTFQSETESQKILMKDVRGIKIAFLSYTYGTNGIRADKGKEFCVNYIDKDKIKKQIQAAKKQGAAIICASLHYGREYIRRPNRQQKELVDLLVEEGVDVILGGHPHVLQPIEIRNVTRDGESKEVVILYSQGNFISAQRMRYRDQGAIFNISLKRNDKTGKVKVEEVSYIPTWVDQTIINGKYNFRVLPIEKSIYEYKQGTDPLISDYDYNVLKRALRDTREVLQTSNIPIVKEYGY